MGKSKKKQNILKAKNSLTINNNSEKNKHTITIYPKCTPRCIFFPNVECNVWTYDENGVKHRADNIEYICKYDGHKIENWNDECPFYRDKVSGKFND